jgi:hypothetical protein
MTQSFYNALIEFKGKPLDGGDWVYGDLVQEHGGVYMQHVHIAHFAIGFTTPKLTEVSRKSVCRFSGVVDDSENKIYGNDIIDVEYEVRIDGGTEKRHTSKEVVFHKGVFWLSDGAEMRDSLEFASNHYKLKVIGNKYD